MRAAHLTPLHVFGRQWVIGGDVVGDLLHEPLKALAAMLFPELLQRADVSVSQGERLGSAGVEIILIFVPPHLHHPHVVLHSKNNSNKKDT